MRIGTILPVFYADSHFTSYCMKINFRGPNRTTVNELISRCILKLEFMYMKHYAPNRWEPRIEVIVKKGPVGVRSGGGGVRGM